jgi:multiple sugar transport system ATP-binding protein
MAEVTLRDVHKRFGDVHIIKGVDLKIADSEFCVFVGPSGCGKSTLLRLIAGLEDISEGRLEIGGHDMTRTPPANRGVAMVFQTVAENIGFGLKMANRPKAEIAQRVAKAAAMLQLGPLLQRKPAQLSGGQRQRVAIGRAIVREPGVFLFDEPLSNLDASLRVQTRIEISRLHQELGSTMIYVTHDQVEAMTMADKIVVLQGGIIEQVGSPLELYHRPRNLFVAGFIGSPKMNFLPVAVTAVSGGVASLKLPGGPILPLPLRGAKIGPGAKATLGVRPEHLSLGEARGAAPAATVRLAEHLGSETMLYLEAADGVPISVRADGLSRAKVGDRVAVGLDPASCHLFDADGRTLVNGSLI